MEVGTGNHEMVSRTLHIQAAKVVAAHAASVGDALLGVPLLCSAGETPMTWLPAGDRRLRESSGLVECISVPGLAGEAPMTWL